LRFAIRDLSHGGAPGKPTSRGLDRPGLASNADPGDWEEGRLRLDNNSAIGRHVPASSSQLYVR